MKVRADALRTVPWRKLKPNSSLNQLHTQNFNKASVCRWKEKDYAQTVKQAIKLVGNPFAGGAIVVLCQKVPSLVSAWVPFVNAPCIRRPIKETYEKVRSLWQRRLYTTVICWCSLVLPLYSLSLVRKHPPIFFFFLICLCKQNKYWFKLQLDEVMCCLNPNKSAPHPEIRHAAASSPGTDLTPVVVDPDNSAELKRRPEDRVPGR